MKYKLLLAGLLLSLSDQIYATESEQSLKRESGRHVSEYEKMAREMEQVELEWGRLFALEEQGISVDQKKYDALTEKQQTLTRKMLLRAAGKDSPKK